MSAIKHPREKTHVKVVAYRAVLGWRDRLLVLSNGKVAMITKMTARRWIPDAKYEAQLRLGLGVGDVAAGKGTVFHVGINKQALAYPEPEPSWLARLFRRLSSTTPDVPSGSPE